MMEHFIELLAESGIKDKLFEVLERNPEANLADIIEYEIMQDENLEDAFLMEAHELAMNMVCGQIMQEHLQQFFLNPEKVEELKDAVKDAVGTLVDAFSSALNGLFANKEDNSEE